MRKTYYSGIKHTKAHTPHLYSIICTTVALLLLIFIIWAGVTYGTYSDQGKDAISQAETLKKQMSEKDNELVETKKMLTKYKDLLAQEQEKVQMLLDTGATLPSASPTPNAGKSTSNANKKTSRRSTNNNQNTTNQANTQTPAETAPSQSPSDAAAPPSETPASPAAPASPNPPASQAPAANAGATPSTTN